MEMGEARAGNSVEGLKMRAVTAGDGELLRELYGSTRTDVALFGWDEGAISAFLEMQFEMQRRSYALQYPHAEDSIVVYRGRDAGRVVIDRQGSAIVLVDIVIAPEFRGRGIGTEILGLLTQEAALNDRSIELQVDVNNQAAASLYVRLGFREIGDSGFSRRMRWDPPLNS